jgi:hypothetical protein
MKIRKHILPISLALCAGCATWASQPIPGPGEERLVGSVRVTTDVAAPVVLDSAFVRGDSLIGIAREARRRRVAVPLASVRDVAKAGTDVPSTLAVIGVIVGFAGFFVFKYLVPPST